MRKRLRGVIGIVILGVALLLALPTAFGAEVKLWSDVADTSWFNQHARTATDPYLRPWSHSNASWVQTAMSSPREGT